MTKAHRIVFLMSYVVVVIDLVLFIYFYRPIIEWVSHNLWIVIIPFFKIIIKKITTAKLFLFLKAISLLLFHLSKLLLLKIFKTLAIRYGVFFTQRKWRWIRWLKVMFLRRGKQLFKFLNTFWHEYNRHQKRFILFAFFPIVLILFLLGLSFNITRKTMVKKTQETAIFQSAVSASNSSRGIRVWLSRLDQKILQEIKSITLNK